jgi:hypothetical protein
MQGRFRDVARILVAALDGRTFPTATITGVGIVTPPDLEDLLPFVRVRAGGGIRDHLQWTPTATLDVFAPTYELGWPLVEDIDAYLTDPASRRDGLSGLDRVSTESGPQEVPWLNDTFRSWAITYQVVTRRKAG